MIATFSFPYRFSPDAELVQALNALIEPPIEWEDPPPSKSAADAPEQAIVKSWTRHTAMDLAAVMALMPKNKKVMSIDGDASPSNSLRLGHALDGILQRLQEIERTLPLEAREAVVINGVLPLAATVRGVVYDEDISTGVINDHLGSGMVLVWLRPCQNPGQPSLGQTWDVLLADTKV